jgi:hypothetical protein
MLLYQKRLVLLREQKERKALGRGERDGPSVPAGGERRYHIFFTMSADGFKV